MGVDFGLARAIELLDQGEVVGLPTETVYGLAARVDRPLGLDQIFKIKQRPLFDPLIVHVESITMAQRYASVWPKSAEILAKEFWPGPLTLVLPKSDLVPSIVTSGLKTVGLRVPKNQVALDLIRACSVGLAAPSANRFGKTSPTRWEHVESEFQGTVYTLKSEPSQVGIESTVLEIQDSKLILHRPGSITREQIDLILNRNQISFSWHRPSEEKKVSPGQMKHHYMPSVPLVWIEAHSRTGKASMEEHVKQEYLSAITRIPDEVEGVKIVKPLKVDRVQELLLPKDPVLAARELYHQMRVVAQAADLIYFKKQDWMEGESWSPILERLTKAASLKLH